MHPSREAHRSACPLHPRETPGQAVSPGRTSTPRRSRSPRPAAAGSGERGVLDQEQHEHDPGHPRARTSRERSRSPGACQCPHARYAALVLVGSVCRRRVAGVGLLPNGLRDRLGRSHWRAIATFIWVSLSSMSSPLTSTVTWWMVPAEREWSCVVGGDRRSGIGAARSGRRRPGSSRRSAPTATHGSAGSAPRPRPPTGAAARPSVRPGGRAGRGGGGRSPARPLPSGC
jgi:hypothetical protein